MLKVLRAVEDKFEIEDLSDGDKDIVSTETLVLLLAKNEFEGCKHSRNGIEVWYDGVDKYEIPIEVWKPVSEFNILLPSGKYKYEVSNLGNVRVNEYVDSFGHLREARLLSISRSKGYRRVTLWISKYNVKTLFVHRLVGTEFVPNPDKLPQINHLNEQPGDDWAGNLSWCTCKENVNYGTAIQRSAINNRKAVRQYSVEGELIAEYDSASSAGIAFGTTARANISLCCKRSKAHNHCNGFVWRFTDDDEFYTLSVEERMALIQYCFIPVIRQYTLDGILLGTFASVRDASLKLGYNYASIRFCVKRESYSYNECIWRLSTDDEFCQVPITQLSIRKKSSRRHCGVNQYSLNGVLLNEFKSLSEASSVSKLSSDHIGSYCRSKCADLVNEFLWRYADDDELFAFCGNVPIYVLNPKTVRQYTLRHEFVAEYEDCADAARKVGRSESNILRASRRKTGHATSGGYIWRLASDDEFADIPENAVAIEEWRQSHNV